MRACPKVLFSFSPCIRLQEVEESIHAIQPLLFRGARCRVPHKRNRELWRADLASPQLYVPGRGSIGVCWFAIDLIGFTSSWFFTLSLQWSDMSIALNVPCYGCGVSFQRQGGSTYATRTVICVMVTPLEMKPYYYLNLGFSQNHYFLTKAPLAKRAPIHATLKNEKAYHLCLCGRLQ